ncbi:hypothetical protein SO802_003668 [Lithocarpus litseifolius]|uniref:ABC1 atypical kinase-like domain-containing protein n=1 Tax=Lithocarpus litseifolius TaxID=425828 RepID=A0AAW2E4L3_9ROSI
MGWTSRPNTSDSPPSNAQSYPDYCEEVYGVIIGYRENRERLKRNEGLIKLIYLTSLFLPNRRLRLLSSSVFFFVLPQPKPLFRSSLPSTQAALPFPQPTPRTKTLKQYQQSCFTPQDNNIECEAQRSETLVGPTRDWIGIYEECSTILYQEIDYINEGKNAGRFRRDFRNIKVGPGVIAIDPKLIDESHEIAATKIPEALETVSSLNGVTIQGVSFLENEMECHDFMENFASRLCMGNFALNVLCKVLRDMIYSKLDFISETNLLEWVTVVKDLMKSGLGLGFLSIVYGSW